MFRAGLPHHHVLRTFSSFVEPKIDLTPAEEKLFEVLQFIRKKYAPKATLRVAGGWVRDKMLGIPSDDIDIALDTMTGEAFVKKILHFQNTAGVPVKGFYIVKKNAEQSKHLSCAAIKLLGHELDFVHLRNESYSDPTSRIPTLSETLATPKEDAMRRDITINALFYNLSTRSIEDFTGKGLIDLDRGVIRTPLAPMETFLDDPLRVLRAVRFAAQYDFKLDSALRQAIQSERVQEALTKKVTRERIGIEVRKMLSGANPHQAMTLLNQARLEAIVFPFISQENILSGLSCLQFVQASERNPSQNQFEKEQFDPRHMLASFMAHPLSNDGSEAVNQSIQAMLNIEVPVVDDVMLVEAALSYIRQSQEMDNQANKRMTDAIKNELKWSKVESKHVADLLDAFNRFIFLASARPDNQVLAIHLAMWCRSVHGSRFDQAMPMLWHVANPSAPAASSKVEELRKSSWAKIEPIKIMMDARELNSLLKGSKWNLSHMIELVAVWEWMNPEKSLEDERVFIQKVLKPLVVKP
ncbi:unnamed protein product [Aphanomyces euteiches]|uniref:Poly A polymerase head domain-containing protein n=1 Tax=Aphanomyces euteiches TaxID=100861 RepID=A0A6G0X6P8_9STRA|nr:hypothetical protein Ae201684_007939 [Aphanomyces euteiches]KAH9074623.1 hypothetical protein Ae201684P_022425 [Aphanomyces euteiches]